MIRASTARRIATTTARVYEQQADRAERWRKRP
jgi:hypothetical protein